MLKKLEITVARQENLAKKAIAHGVPRAAIMGSDVGLVRAIQTAAGKEACFRSERRLTCRKFGCEWREDCCRLVAVWQR